MVCMNSFDTLIESNVDLFLPVDLNCIHGEGEHNIYNAFIGVIPNHPVFKICLEMIVNNVENENWWNGDKLPLEFSGPGLLGCALNKYLGRNERDSFKNICGILRTENISINFLKFTNESTNFESKYIGDISSEFIQTVDNKYIFQNKNGNYFIKKFYEQEVVNYNTISWVDIVLNNKKPYLSKRFADINTVIRNSGDLINAEEADSLIRALNKIYLSNMADLSMENIAKFILKYIIQLY